MGNLIELIAFLHVVSRSVFQILSYLIIRVIINIYFDTLILSNHFFIWFNGSYGSTCLMIKWKLVVPFVWWKLIFIGIYYTNFAHKLLSVWFQIQVESLDFLDLYLNFGISCRYICLVWSGIFGIILNPPLYDQVTRSELRLWKFLLQV